MKSKLPVALLLLLAASLSVSARYTLFTDSNNVTTISFTNAFYEGVCTVEGREGTRWVPLQNFFTTQRVGQVQFSLPTNYSRFRVVSLAIGPGNMFTRLATAYGSIHTIAGGGTNAWEEGANATDISFADARYATADEAGNIYVVDRGTHSVNRITPDGKIHTFVGTRKSGYTGDLPNQIATNYPLSRPSAIFYAQSNLFILDAGNSRIVVVGYASVPTVGDVVGFTNYTPKLVQYDTSPGGIGTNSAGLWVSTPSSTLEPYEAFFGDGTKLKHLEESTISVLNSNFQYISHVTVNPQGRTIVCDPLDNRAYRVRGNGNKEVVAGNGFVKTITTSGKVKRVGLPGASSVWYLPIGGYLISLDSGARIWCVDADDQAAPLVFGAPGVHEGDGKWFRAGGRAPKISNALSVTLAPNGDMIILEREGLVRKIDFLRHIP